MEKSDNIYDEIVLTIMNNTDYIKAHPLDYVKTKLGETIGYEIAGHILILIEGNEKNAIYLYQRNKQYNMNAHKISLSDPDMLTKSKEFIDNHLVKIKRSCSKFHDIYAILLEHTPTH